MTPRKYPSDLKVTFDPMLKTFNLYHNYWTIWDKSFIFLMYIPYVKALYIRYVYDVVWWDFDRKCHRYLLVLLRFFFVELIENV